MQLVSTFKILIIERDSGMTLIQRNYGQDTNSSDVVKNNLITYLSTFNEDFEKPLVGKVKLGGHIIVYETSKSFIFVTIARKDLETLKIRKILNHIKVEFLRTFPIQRGSWQLDENVSCVSKFESTIDEIIFNIYFSSKPLKIVLVGLDNAGKTTLVHTYADSKTQSEYLPTKGLDILKISYKGFQLHFWDLGGQKQFHKLWQRFTTEASGILFIVDSSTNRWDEIKTAYSLIKSMNHPTVIFGNKQDLFGEVKDKTFFSKSLEVCPSRISLGSALLGEGIYEALDLLITEILGFNLNK